MRGYGPPNGFYRVLAGSFFLHVLVLAAAMVIKAEPKKFFTPVFTVDLVGPGGPAQARPAQPQAPPRAALPEKPAAKPVEKAAPVQEKAAPKEREPAVKLAPRKPREAPRGDTVEEALKKIEKDVKRKDDSAMVDSKIEAMKKRHEADSKRLSEELGAVRKDLKARQEANAKPAREAASQGPASGTARLNSQYPAYYAIIRDRVQEQWVYPEGLKTDNVTILVSIRIARSGKLLDSWIEKSSGNRRFDDSLLDAIRKAAPFPALPQEFEGQVFETGFRFCPGCNG